ncbi:MAG: hypothetical protein DDT38_01526 [Firmicutes bacterium]|nr:hypothetical protein [candidate division NPL-UPA2 bacterium]
MTTGSTFTALGREYTICFDNRAFRTAEKSMGHSLSAMQDSIGSLTTLLHAGLSRHHPKISIDDVDEIVDELGYEKIAVALGEAMAASPPLRSRTPQA